MSARPPYGSQLISFVPQCNAVIMANHFLQIKSQDHGTWRRIRVVPFMSLFTDNPVQGDPNKPYQFKKTENFDSKFESWKLIFMAMLVKRACETNGIAKECAVVKASSNKYRENQDFLAEFIGEKIVKDANGRIKKSELCFEFNEWYKNTYGGRVNKTKELYSYMDKLFGECKKNTWTGVKIYYESDDNGREDNITISTKDEEDEEIEVEDAIQML
jgi:phage/plasmid-associated DNA primase